MRIAALILSVAILAGCGSHKPLAQQVEVNGDTLTMPDGSTLRLDVSDAAGTACPVEDYDSGIVTLDPADVSAVGWTVTVDGC